MNHREIIDLWPRQTQLSDDTGASIDAVYVWRHRCSIPPSYWRRVMLSAIKRGLDVSIVDLKSGYPHQVKNGEFADV
jgi:hypothetical protein